LAYACLVCDLLSCLFLPRLVPIALGLALPEVARADLEKMRQGVM
jgi:hypothetical protein